MVALTFLYMHVVQKLRQYMIALANADRSIKYKLTNYFCILFMNIIFLSHLEY